MSKFDKLIKSPRSFARDAVLKRYPALKLKPMIEKARATGKPTAILVGFSDWKTWMVDALPDYHVVFLGYSPRIATELLRAVPKFPNATVFVWSYKYPEELNDICARHDIPIVYVEDGFIRSVGLGIAKTAPLSLVLDKQGMHFDRSRVSDLDVLLNTTDFSTHPEALSLADRVVELAKDGMTKYIKADADAVIEDHVFREDGLKNILVLGQVEDDMSIQRGMAKLMTGNDLVRIVALNNPEANIFYRPHPEALERRKKHYSNPNDVKDMCQIIGRRWSLNETLRIVEEVHTMTSLAGFEAAMRGHEVHTYGMPFYAGWGFTTDHGLSDVPEKRTRKITIREAIAGAYILYPVYFDPILSEPISAARGIDVAAAMTRRLKHDIRVKKIIAQRKEDEELESREQELSPVTVKGHATLIENVQADHIVAVIKELAKRIGS